MITRKIKVETKTLDEICIHQYKIKKLKSNRVVVDKMFLNLKQAILKDDYFLLKNILENMFLEELDIFYINKMFTINRKRIDYFINLWKNRYLEIGEQGFYTTILSSF